MQIYLTYFALFISIIGMFTDIEFGKIYNWLTVPAFIVMALLVLSSIDQTFILVHLLSLLLMIVVSIPIFSLNMMGGGDIKLLYLISLAFPYEIFVWILFGIFITGGVCALIIMLTDRKRKSFAYGIPICVGLMASLAHFNLFFIS